MPQHQINNNKKIGYNSLHLANIVKSDKYLQEKFVCSNNCAIFALDDVKITLFIMADTTKRERFTKVASTRVSKILNYLTLLQNCSNRNNYEYDADDVEQMFSEITKALKDTRNVYMNELSKQNSKGGFKFNK